MTEYHLDAKGLLCPMPVIRVQQKIQTLASGNVLHVVCTDPGVQYDIPAWCKVHGHTLLAMEKQAELVHISIRVE